MFLFETEDAHDNHETNPTKGLFDEVKKYVAAKYFEGIRKPKALLDLLRKGNFTEPNKSKLETYLRALRHEHLGCPTVSAREICEWCDARKSPPQSKDDRLF